MKHLAPLQPTLATRRVDSGLFQAHGCTVGVLFAQSPARTVEGLTLMIKRRQPVDERPVQAAVDTALSGQCIPPEVQG